MAEPKHKVREKKKKGLVHKLQNSALFILLMIILAGIMFVSAITWLSDLLSQGTENLDWKPLWISAGIAAFFGVFFGAVWANKKIEARA